MSWRMFFIRLVEIVFIINIALLDLLAFQSFPKYTASVATSHVMQSPKPTSTPIVANPTTPVPTVIQTIVQTAGPKELFVPLGAGNSTETDWTNVPGVIASVDSSKYPGLKQVTFEANITVPTANETVWVQLYDMTDEHPVWNSQLSMTGATQYIVSPPITLDPGNKLYQVQMKTQLQYPATLDFARIHILLN